MDLKKLYYKSKISGVGGRIKEIPESFIVQEIGPTGNTYYTDAVLEKSKTVENFLHIVLQKKNWSTEDAVARVAEALGINHKRFSWSGTKDRRAITTQLVSVFGLNEKQIETMDKLELKDIAVLGYWGAKEKVKFGQHIGNRFKIILTDSDPDSDQLIREIYTDLGGKFPNYFGPQRFGKKNNNHIIGKRIIQGNFYEAVMLFLTETEENEKEEIASVKKELKDTKDFKKAIESFPRNMRHEIRMLEHLNKKPGDFVGALRAIHRSVSLRFIHAYQSYLFNRVLSDNLEKIEERKQRGGERVEDSKSLNSIGDDKNFDSYCGTNSYGFPDIEQAGTAWQTSNIIGYDTKITEEEAELLEDENISKDDFKIRSVPELSSKGSVRTMLVPIKNFTYSNAAFTFELPKGAYATSMLREFMDKK